MKQDDFTWEENSSAMYETTVKAAPAFVRPILKKRLLNALAEKAGDSAVVTEAVFFDALKSTTPESKLDKILGELEALKTT